MQKVSSLGGDTTDLLRSVAEQLKVPLTIIARQAELSQMAGVCAPQDIVTVHSQAKAALTLVDSYLLGLELTREQGRLELEPVSISSTLVGIAHDLYYLARQNNVELDVQIAGKYEPVMANQRGLRAALISLGYGLVEATGEQKHRHLTLAVHRTPHGIVAGMYSDYKDLEAKEWRRALELCGRAAQPFTGLSAGSGAGLFVADVIMRSMETRLRVGRHQKECGLAATFYPSKQLTLV